MSEGIPKHIYKIRRKSHYATFSTLETKQIKLNEKGIQGQDIQREVGKRWKELKDKRCNNSEGTVSSEEVIISAFGVSLGLAYLLFTVRIILPR
jgi:hypothetical protein